MPRKTSRKSRYRRKSSGRNPMKGWAAAAPRSIRPRRALRSRCGSKCFLSPGNLKYPICRKSGSCRPDCRALLAAISRSKQYNRAPNIAKKARSIAKRIGCGWTR